MPLKRIIKTKRLPIVLALILLIVLLAVAYEPYKEYREDISKRDKYKNLMSLVKMPKKGNFFEKSDTIRQFVNKNSVHNIDDEFRSYWNKHDIIAKKIADFSTGKIATPVHLECSTRSRTMRYLANLAGIKTRKIVLYEYGENFRSHVFIEVQNPDTKEWHIQDPGYDLFWKDRTTGTRLSTIELLKKDMDSVVPCYTQENCGWNWNHKASQGNPNALKSYFALAVIHYEPWEKREIFYNPEHFDLEKPQTVEGKGKIKFCKFAPGECEGRITIVK